MVLDLLGSKKPATVSDLVARKKYPEALALLSAQLKKTPGDPSLRMQVADILVLQGKIDDATRTLEAVADGFAKDGFAAKAIAVLKKIQKLDPRRKDLEARIVELFKTSGPRSFGSDSPRAAASPAMEFGMLAAEEGEALDLGFSPEPSPAEVSVPAPAAEPVVEAVPFLSEEAPLSIDIDESPAVEVDSEAPSPRKMSPLFDDFAEDELLEVIRGLELRTFEPGDIIMTEGEKGDSLYVLTSGSAKAFIRNKQGSNSQVRQLNEGDFFGEISILTGKPRTATITAAAQCEMLRLDRPTLDAITAKRPRVLDILKQFCDERTRSAAEADVRGLDSEPSETLRQAGLASDQQAESPAPETVVIAVDDAGDDSTESRLQHLKQVAIDSSRKQNWPDAVQAWQQYLALKPEDVEAGSVLGVLFGKLGRWKDAAQTFERIVQQNSKDPTVYFNLGLSYRQLEMLPQAATAYRKAIALKPDYEKAKQNLTSVLNRIKKEAMA